MLTAETNEDVRTSFWPRVREFAVPTSVIETATARRLAGDWAGACVAAGFDVDLNLRSVARVHGRELAGRVRSDLRALAPDLLRWHMPRIAPDGLLRPGLTLSLARYAAFGHALHLVVRTAPAWADAGQRITLALWPPAGSDPCRHPHPRPGPRFRLDLHRHLWDAGRADELRVRAGVGLSAVTDPVLLNAVPPGLGCAVGRWADEARIVLGAEGRSAGAVLVRLGGRHRLVLEVPEGAGGPVRIAEARPPYAALPVLPDAATWVPPDLELLDSGAIEADQLHPLVAAALAPDHVRRRSASGPPSGPRYVECRGAVHRIGLVDGVLVPLDHDPEEIRREELLVALTGTPLPCLQAVDRAHRRPHSLDDVRERLAHGDIDGALAVVEELLGPDALLRAGPLRDALEAAARQRVVYGLFKAGLAGDGPARKRWDEYAVSHGCWCCGDRRRRDVRARLERRSHPRHANLR
ncbi:hypothetical protein ABZ896_42430 [Streptomyces sp. NPDC047072]|uniref:hypothetical protein n=1 Tax=Streptomyces sp. NPDC047072 TaxID=3154809 RepID=UPI00340AB2FF